VKFSCYSKLLLIFDASQWKNDRFSEMHAKAARFYKTIRRQWTEDSEEAFADRLFLLPGSKMNRLEAAAGSDKQPQ
jgi:hypothetical protein